MIYLGFFFFLLLPGNTSFKLYCVQNKKEAKNVTQLGDFSVNQESMDNMGGHKFDRWCTHWVPSFSISKKSMVAMDCIELLGGKYTVRW